MKAVICARFGEPETLIIDEIPAPVLVAGEALVRVAGAGLNFADMVFIRGQYQQQREPPFVVGAEVFGQILEVAGTSNFKAGDWIIGQVLTGAYAEFAAVDTRQAVRLTCEMPTAEAAGFFVNYGTAYSALLQRAHARAGETALILGASGGVGLAALQVAKAIGMNVIADCRGEAKQNLAREQGADLVVDYTQDDFRRQIRSFTKGVGCDIVIDMIGGAATQAALKCVAWCGRIVIVGFTSGEAFRIPANHLLVKNCNVIGHWWGDYHRRDRKQLDDAFAHLFQLYREKRLRPVISGILDLRDVPDGIRRLASRSVMGKLVTVL